KAALDVDAGVGGLKVRERAGADRICASGFGGRGAKERVEIPAATLAANEVQAGFVDADGADLKPSSPQREEANGGGDGAGVEDRLGAEFRVFVHSQVSEDKAGTRKQAEVDRGEAH